MSEDGVFRALVPGLEDVERMRRLARRAHDLGCDVADCAARARSTAATDWRSAAADAFRSQLTVTCRAVDACADGLEEASAALARHALTSESQLPR